MKSHADQCQANHEGSSGKMEVDAAIEMFKRSESLHGVKCAFYIGDGDSKTFKGILEAKPYENCLVQCIDHVQKKGHSFKKSKKTEQKVLGEEGNLY